MKQSATLIFYASMQGISFEVKKHVTMNKWNKFKVFLFFCDEKIWVSVEGISSYLSIRGCVFLLEFLLIHLSWGTNLRCAFVKLIFFNFLGNVELFWVKENIIFSDLAIFNVCYFK